jgi:hypothetical protein
MAKHWRYEWPVPGWEVDRASPLALRPDDPSNMHWQSHAAAKKKKKALEAEFLESFRASAPAPTSISKDQG